LTAEHALYLAARLLMVALCAVAAIAALRRWRLRRDRWAPGALAALVLGAALSQQDARLSLDATSPVTLTGMSWAWLAFDFAVPVLALYALRLMRERDVAMDAVLALAESDPLTGLPNRRGFEARAAAALQAARRTGAPSTLLALDLDRFKRINDGHGHPAGDAVLRALAVVLRDGLRAQDVPGRLGGEEFAVLLPATGPEEATAIAARLLAAVPHAVPHPGGAGEVVTTSIGLAQVPRGRPGRALAVALARADRALYAAKRGGRNRVEHWAAERGRLAAA